MRNALIAFMLAVAAVPGSGTAATFEAERAFAQLLFGRYFEDPCANTSQGAQTCRPVFGDRTMKFVNEKASQAYQFAENRCIVRADTTVTATGKRYRAVFNLQNVLYVNLNKFQQVGDLKEVELYLQGDRVLETDGRKVNALIFIHKYYATPSGSIGHDVKQDVLDMRKALKAYQQKYCGGMG